MNNTLLTTLSNYQKGYQSGQFIFNLFSTKKIKRKYKERTILNREQKRKFLQENWKFETMIFNWSKNGVCRMYDKRSNKTQFYAGGYGYDKKGTVLGNFINHYFGEELKKLNSAKYYGLTHYNTKSKYNHKRTYLKRATKNTKSYVDGGCGFDCMERILKKIGFNLKYISESKTQLIYILT